MFFCFNSIPGSVPYFNECQFAVHPPDRITRKCWKTGHRFVRELLVQALSDDRPRGLQDRLDLQRGQPGINFTNLMIN